MKRSEASIKEEALQHKVPIMNDGGLAFLLELIVKENVSSILELGTAVAYSSIRMASLREDIHVDTVEKEAEMVLEARKNISEAGLEGRITVYQEEAESFVSDKVYDLIFVDAAKAQYAKYLERYLPNLKEDGVMVFDNMVFHDMIYHVDDLKNRGTRSMVRKIIKFRESVKNDERFDIMMYDSIGDGILVLRRRRI